MENSYFSWSYKYVYSLGAGEGKGLATLASTTCVIVHQGYKMCVAVMITWQPGNAWAMSN